MAHLVTHFIKTGSVSVGTESISNEAFKSWVEENKKLEVATKSYYLASQHYENFVTAKEANGGVMTENQILKYASQI